MTSGHKSWSELLRSTFREVGKKDIVGLYSLEWKHAKEKLIAEDREALERERKRWKRFFKTANSILFGLARRLAPARRVLFLGVLLCLVLSLNGPSVSRQTKVEGGQRRTTEYRFDFDNFYLLSATVLLGTLLAMELVDKINYRDELELARELQKSLIPRDLPKTPSFELGAHNEIANMVGGDIYDFVPLSDGRLAVLFGDASGHGMAAGLVMAVAHAAFRTQLDVDAEPGAMFATLNRILCRTGSPRAFFSCASMVFRPDGAFSVAVAGHPPALRAGPDGGVRQRFGAGAYPLGIKPGLSWPVEEGRLEPGEILLLHSDGLSETRSPEGQDFEDARIEATLRAAIRLPAEQLAAALADEARRFRQSAAPDDDVTVAVIRRKG